MTSDPKWQAFKNPFPGYESEPEDEVPLEKRIAEHERQENARLSEHLTKCGVPRLARDRITAGLEPCPSLEAIERWHKSGLPFLLLYGAAGAWKTTPAGSVLKSARREHWFLGPDGPVRSWVYDHRRGLFVHACELRGWAYNAEGEAKLARARKVPWLVVDDLGTETLDGAGIWLSALEYLVDHRYANGLKTVITTNLDVIPDEKRARNSDGSFAKDARDFRDHYGERIARRIREEGVVACAGKAARMVNA